MSLYFGFVDIMISWLNTFVLHFLGFIRIFIKNWFVYCFIEYIRIKTHLPLNDCFQMCIKCICHQVVPQLLSKSTVISCDISMKFFRTRKVNERQFLDELSYWTLLFVETSSVFDFDPLLLLLTTLSSLPTLKRLLAAKRNSLLRTK